MTYFSPSYVYINAGLVAHYGINVDPLVGKKTPIERNIMGAKRVLDAQQVVTDGDMSGDITTSATQILYTDRPSYELVWTGTPTGDFSVEVSNTGNSWAPVTLSSPITAAGSADNAFIDIESGAKYVRLKYTAGGGSGTLQAYVVSKSISG